MPDDYYGGGDFGSAGTGAYSSYFDEMNPWQGGASYGTSQGANEGTGEGGAYQAQPSGYGFNESPWTPSGVSEGANEGTGEGGGASARSPFNPASYWPKSNWGSGSTDNSMGGYTGVANDFGRNRSVLGSGGAGGGAGGAAYPGTVPNLGQQKLNMISPYVQRVLGSMQGAAPGGQAGPQPAINTNPIYSPQQIQQQMNSAFSSNDSRTATLMKQLMESNAARGFGGNSPALQAQKTQLGIANNAANANAQREIPLQYAQPNADQAFRVNQLQQQQWQQEQAQDIERRKIQQQQLGQLLGFFGSFG